MENKFMWDGVEIPEFIQIQKYWSRGTGISTLREALPHNHPEHLYNYVKNQLGVPPEAYGIYHPFTEKYMNKTREELIARISELEDIVTNNEMYL
jgi:hypothetical protein